MKDQLVSFEIATIAFKKGFNHIQANIFGDNMAYKPDGELIVAHNAGNTYVLASTQSLLSKWLRDIHLLQVHVFSGHTASGDILWGVDVYNLKKGNCIEEEYKLYSSLKEDTNKLLNSYEEAIEVGLKYALETLPNI